MVNASLYYSWCKGAIAILQSAKILYIYTGKSQLKTYRYGIITGKEWIKLPVQKRRLCWRFLGNTVLNDAEGTTNNNTSWFTFWKWKIHLWHSEKLCPREPEPAPRKNSRSRLKTGFETLAALTCLVRARKNLNVPYLVWARCRAQNSDS